MRRDWKNKRWTWRERDGKSKIDRVWDGQMVIEKLQWNVEQESEMNGRERERWIKEDVT